MSNIQETVIGNLQIIHSQQERIDTLQKLLDHAIAMAEYYRATTDWERASEFLKLSEDLYEKGRAA